MSENKVDISTETIAVLDAALADFYRARSLVSAQIAANIHAQKTSLEDTIEKLGFQAIELNNRINELTSPTARGDDDAALAALLRDWLNEDVRTPSMTDSLYRDALRIVERTAE